MEKSYQIVLIHNDVEVLHFDCPANLSIFRGAHRAGIEMSAGCMQGRCQICRASLCAGQVKSLRPLSKYATLDPAAMPNNIVLPCSVVPCSDVYIAPRGPWRIMETTLPVEPRFLMLNFDAMPVWD